MSPVSLLQLPLLPVGGDVQPRAWKGPASPPPLSALTVARVCLWAPGFLPPLGLPVLLPARHRPGHRGAAVSLEAGPCRPPPSCLSLDTGGFPGPVASWAPQGQALSTQFAPEPGPGPHGRLPAAGLAPKSVASLSRPLRRPGWSRGSGPVFYYRVCHACVWHVEPALPSRGKFHTVVTRGLSCLCRDYLRARVSLLRPSDGGVHVTVLKSPSLSKVTTFVLKCRSV